MSAFIISNLARSYLLREAAGCTRLCRLLHFFCSTWHPPLLVYRGFTFAPHVGYQNKGFDAKFNYVANTFVPVGADKNEMTLGDIVPNDDFVDSSIQFLTPGGATATVSFGGKTYKATYKYWREDDEPEQGPGWYFASDTNGDYNQNDRVIPFGDAYCVDRSATETDAGFVFAGQVEGAVTKEFTTAKFNYIGNCSPTQITLGDLTPNDDFVDSSIQFLTSGGATATVSFGGKTYKATYKYWREDDEPEQGPGWYFASDTNGDYNQNARIIAAGEAFCADISATELGASLTIPDPLN